MQRILLIFLVSVLSVQDVFSQLSFVADINSVSSSSPDKFIYYNGRIVFSASDETYGRELFEYNGTTVSLVADINPGTTGIELWKYNGIVPSLVADLTPGPSSSQLWNFTVVGDTLFFVGEDGTAEIELYKYDGIVISLAADIPATAFTSLLNPTAYKNELYFTIEESINGRELWKYNGQVAGLVYDLYPDSLNSWPGQLTVLNDTLYFTANDGNTGTEIWRYYGTVFEQLADIRPGGFPSVPMNLFAWDGVLYFSATDGNTGMELWKYTSTPSSLSITEQTANEILVYPNPAGEKIYFRIPEKLNKEFHICLYSMDGKLILSDDCFTNNNTGLIELDCSSYSQGIYFLRLISDEKCYSGKIIKQ